MKEIVIIANKYAPNTAVTNRLLSFVTAFSKMGVQVTLFFVRPDNNRSLLTDEFQHVSVHHLWQNSPHNKILSYIKSFYDIKSIRKSLAGKNVLLLGAEAYLTILSKNKSIKLYHERTEHPEVVPWPIFLSRKSYYMACRDIAGLFVISTALKRHFCDKGCNEEKVHIINMTVDSSRFSSLSKTNEKDKYIAYCGTASNNKDGVDELIKSFAIVKRSHPEFKLLIIGKALSKKDSSGNLQLIAALGLQDSVQITGIIPASKIPQLLKDAEILALDRPYSLQTQCGFPTKLGEYLLTGNPVVLTRVGDIPLFLKDGESALIAEERNAQDFALKLIWAIENPEEAKKIGKVGALVARQHFDSMIEAEKILKIMKLS